MRIKQLRKNFGLSQIELAERVGISFQQIQKYEKGVSKISVFRLQQISEALGTTITDFLGEGHLIPKVSSSHLEYSLGKNPPQYLPPLNQEEIIILKLFRKIRNKKLKEGILKQIRGAVELERKK